MIALLTTLTLLIPAAGERVTLFLGPPRGVGDVQVVDADGLGPIDSPPELQAIRLVPIELAGRSRVDELLPNRARLRTDVPGAARLVLPAGAGSLYRYRRDEVGGAATFGFFVVGSDGAARSVFERPGSGTPAATDPFVDRVAVAEAGDALLLATTLAAGGDVFEVDLATGAASLRTATIPPLDLHGGGLRLLPNWGTATSPDGVLRFARTPGAEVELVAFPGASWYGGDVVTSADGTTAATTLGIGPTQAFVVAFGAAGPASPVTLEPAWLSRGGFLPEAAGGPHLALSTDGSFCAWRTEGTVLTPREAWVGPVTTPAATTQITADALFADTLDETGDFLFFSPAGLLLLVGEKDPAGVDKADLYRVDAGAGGATVTNVSLTSGDAVAPFDFAGELSSEAGVWLAPDLKHFVAHARVSGGGDVIAIDPALGGATVLRSDVKSLDLVEPVGDRLVLSVRRDAAAKERELLAAPPGLAGPAALLLKLPDGAELLRPATSPDGRIALVATFGLQEWLATFDPASGAVALLTSLPLSFGPMLGFTAASELGFSVAVGAPAFHLTWPSTGALVLLPTSPAPGFVLPGA